MHIYKTLLLDDTFETYNNMIISFDMFYDDNLKLLTFNRMRGPNINSLNLVKKLSISISLDEFKDFCTKWIENLKSLTLFQYEDFLNESGGFVDEIYASKRDSVKNFPATVTTLSTFKWNNLLSVKYYYNNNIIISALKKGKELLSNDSANKINFTKVEVPMSEYYALYYIKKYYKIRLKLNEILSEL